MTFFNASDYLLIQKVNNLVINSIYFDLFKFSNTKN